MDSNNCTDGLSIDVHSLIFHWFILKLSLDLTGAIKMFSWTLMLSLTFVEANVIIKLLWLRL